MKIQIYKDKRGEWRWRIKTKNGRVIADSAEGYKRKSGAARAAYRLCDAFGVSYTIHVDAIGGVTVRWVTFAAAA